MITLIATRWFALPAPLRPECRGRGADHHALVTVDGDYDVCQGGAPDPSATTR
jgi:hypothetical protein